MILSFHQKAVVFWCFNLFQMYKTFLFLDSFADDLTQKRYIECVSSTKLLAKFLAFSEFSPYYTDKPLPEQVLNLHCAMRQRVIFL